MHWQCEFDLLVSVVCSCNVNNTGDVVSRSRQSPLGIAAHLTLSHWFIRNGTCACKYARESDMFMHAEAHSQHVHRWRFSIGKGVKARSHSVEERISTRSEEANATSRWRFNWSDGYRYG